MGAEPWSYFVSYEDDIQAALEKLRQREFQAGRFRYSEENPESIDEAIEIADADGTASILDIEYVSGQPDYGAVAPLAPERIMDLYGTAQPTRSMVESNWELFEQIDQGQGVYLIVHEAGQPSEIFFAGYSFD